MKQPMHQIYVTRESDNALTGRAVYRVLECFKVTVDVADKYYAGRRVFRCNWRDVESKKRKPGCVIFARMPQQKGSFISLRGALGIKKAGRA